MFYLANRADCEVGPSAPSPDHPVLNADAIEQIRDMSRASALEASAWGIAYPDTMRAIFPPAVRDTVDRGWAIEQVWRQRMQAAGRSDLRLSDLGRASLQNQLPVVVFKGAVATVTDVFERPEGQRERGPKLVGDVSEKA